MSSISHEELFLWDLQGYLVIEGVLPAEQVAALNAGVDAHVEERRGDGVKGARTRALDGEGGPRQIMSGMLTWESPQCDPWRDLIAQRKLVPYLNTFLGDGFRMDQEPFLFVADKGAEGLVLHGPGHTTIGEGFSYEYAHGRTRSGMITVEFHLTDAVEGEGGFCCVPGSHKSEVKVPQSIADWESHQDLVVNPSCRAGGVIIFNEATLHGTLPWTAGHQRRVALYRFSPKFMQLGGGMHSWVDPPWFEELTEAQRMVMQPPTIVGRKTLDDQGNVVDPTAPVAG